jgi:mycothiol synthase
VGALIASVSDDRGWVDVLGVLAPWRGRGIAGALLRRSFATFAGRGLRQVLLSVDAENPTGATRLYERVGMRW